jgi:ligand-binding sensor domain-containing protein
MKHLYNIFRLMTGIIKAIQMQQRMPTIFSGILIFLLVTGTFSYCRAADNLQFQENNLSHPGAIGSQNWSITQNTKNGFLYFANSEGLIEYNGLSKTIYHHPKDEKIKLVFVDKQGLVFTGSTREFGFWKKDASGRFLYCSLSDSVSIKKNNEIRRIYQAYGKIYFQSLNAIYVYDYSKISTIKSPFPIFLLFQVGGAFVVQLVHHGLYWFDGESFTFITGSEALQIKKVLAIINTEGSGFLVCTSDYGIYEYNGNLFRPLTSPLSTFLQANTCTAGIILNDSLFAFGTLRNGIVVSDRKGQIKLFYNHSNGLMNNTVHALYKDLYNGLWIGLDEGVNYLAISSYNIDIAHKKLKVSWLQITDLIFFGKGAKEEFSVDMTGKMEVPYFKNNVTVYFADPSKFYEEKKEYFYKIEEMNDKWQKIVTDNFTVSNLKPGTYHLQIKSDGETATTGLSFTILSPWFMSWFAIFLYIMTISMIVLIMVRFFQSRKKK